VTAFKVSRAVAAAALPYEVAREALRLQAGLQPLKYALFARRARHLVLQVRDLCQRMTVRQVRVDADKISSSGASTSPASQQASASAPPAGRQDGSSKGGSISTVHEADAGGSSEGTAQQQQQERVVLAIVGRQYVPYIEEMWANERSALWHGEVPRTFAPSALERLGLS
ncbi:hypothetical protein Agub_g3042, partial [Astrephomene gubernaculifera]